MELKEFDPSRFARDAVRFSRTLEKLNLTEPQKNQIAKDIEKQVTWAVEYYLDVVANNCVIKKKLKAPLTVEDAKGLLAQATEIVNDLKTWKPEWGIPHLKTLDGYEKGDEDAPFFSEAILYVLLGKDPARSLLGRLRRLAEAVGAMDPIEAGF
jgi:hypothetical protein